MRIPRDVAVPSPSALLYTVTVSRQVDVVIRALAAVSIAKTRLMRVGQKELGPRPFDPFWLATLGPF
jgi:hypothetical protein